MEQETVKEQKSAKFSAGLHVIAVQSVLCAAILLAALLFRLAGGNAFAQLRSNFREAMEDNALMAAVVSLFEGQNENA